MKVSERQFLKTSVKGLLFTLLFAATGLISCARQGGAEGAHTYQIPWPTASGEYRLQNITLNSYQQPETLQGSWAKILVDPFLTNGVLDGASPVGRYLKSNGVAVPADYVTLVATTVYAHLERLHDIDVETGAESKIRWPLNIGVQVNVVDRRDPGTFVKNNALYDGGLDALLFVPYTDHGLPIALNAGILAHEHFHRIFQGLVLDQVLTAQKNRIDMKSGERRPVGILERRCAWSEKSAGEILNEAVARVRPSDLRRPHGSLEKIDVPVEVYNEFLLRALNEGLADFWGWVYTGDSNYVGRSLPSGESELRRMDQKVGRLGGIDEIKNRLKDLGSLDGLVSEEVRISLAYRLGTEYALFMRSLALAISDGNEADLNSRMIVARALMKALPQVAETIAARITSDEIQPGVFLKPLFANLSSVTNRSCVLYAQFVAGGAKDAENELLQCRGLKGEK